MLLEWVVVYREQGKNCIVHTVNKSICDLDWHAFRKLTCEQPHAMLLNDLKPDCLLETSLHDTDIAECLLLPHQACCAKTTPQVHEL